MNTYLIPANTKQGELIFGIFRPIDLILLASGISVTLIMMLIFSLSSVSSALLVLAPALICAVWFYQFRIIIMY